MKKRILSLVLTAATILTMTACGSNSEETNKPSSGNTNSLTTNSTESDATQPGDASVPEKEPFKFAGTWRKIQETTAPETEYLVIDINGNMEHFNSNQDKPVQYRLEKTNETDPTYISLKYSSIGEEYYFSLFLERDTYLLSSDNGLYYREEDFVGYDIIDLTPENFAQYIDTVFEFTPQKDSFGDIESIKRHCKIGFKEELGAASYIHVDLNYKEVTTSATYDPTSNTYVLGEVEKTINYEYTREFEIFGARYVEPVFNLYGYFDKNDDGTYFIENLASLEITGAERIIGKVFVPKGWQG